MSEAMPPPSPVLALIAACLIEHEKDAPGFIDRVRVRLQMDVNVSAAVRLRGERAEPAIRAALEGALAWTAILAPIAELEGSAKRKRWFWA